MSLKSILPVSTRLKNYCQINLSETQFSCCHSSHQELLIKDSQIWKKNSKQNFSERPWSSLFQPCTTISKMVQKNKIVTILKVNNNSQMSAILKKKIYLISGQYSWTETKIWWPTLLYSKKCSSNHGPSGRNEMQSISLCLPSDSETWKGISFLLPCWKPDECSIMVIDMQLYVDGCKILP